MSGSFTDNQNSGLTSEAFAVTLTSGSPTTLNTRASLPRQVLGVVLREVRLGARTLTGFAWTYNATTGVVTITPTLDSAGFFDANVAVLFQS